MEDVLSNWDKIAKKKHFPKNKYHKDICGCLLPNDPHVNAGPSAKRFLQRPTLHNKLHKSPATDGGHEGPLPKKSRPENTIVIDQVASGSGVRVDAAVPVTITDRKSGQQSTGFLKSKGKQLKTTGIASFMEKGVGMQDDVWAKKFAMDTVLTGCQKMVSQRASVTFYETVMKGVKGYHNTWACQY